MWATFIDWITMTRQKCVDWPRNPRNVPLFWIILWRKQAKKPNTSLLNTSLLQTVQRISRQNAHINILCKKGNPMMEWWYTRTLHDTSLTRRANYIYWQSSNNFVSSLFFVSGMLLIINRFKYVLMHNSSSICYLY